MPHKNFMPAWDEIRCQRGHDPLDHHAIEHHVLLGGKTGYRDLPPIPRSMGRSFNMFVWDPEVHPVDGGPYCPAHDAVSATIVSHGVWEPRETIVAINAFRSCPDGVFYDIGAQLGWFSLLALEEGNDVVAYEADPDNARMLWLNCKTTHTPGTLTLREERIGPDTALDVTETPVVAFAKLDIEGAEFDAINMLMPLIGEGLVKRMMIEVSPVFRDGYGVLVANLIELGFDAFMLPPRGEALDGSFDGSPASLAPWQLDHTLIDVRATVDSWHQEDVVFVLRED